MPHCIPHCIPHCPRLAEFPQVELYMDQVLNILEGACLPFCPPAAGATKNEIKKERLLTPAMINNYVKQGLLPPPHKKRYQPRHLAALLLICLLKSLLPISDIKRLLAGCFESGGELQPAAYDYFCAALEQAFAEEALPEAAEAPAPLPQPQALLIRQAAQAYAQKVRLQISLNRQS